MNILGFEDIKRSTNRIGFSLEEIEVARKFVLLSAQKGRDLCVDYPGIYDSDQDFMNTTLDGLIVLTSPSQLSSCFCFAKVDAGRGLFGKQKFAYQNYVSGLFDDRWIVGAVRKNWGLSVTGIGNIYRQQGYG